MLTFCGLGRLCLGLLEFGCSFGFMDLAWLRLDVVLAGFGLVVFWLAAGGLPALLWVDSTKPGLVSH